jgi:hypothetical protein
VPDGQPFEELLSSPQAIPKAHRQVIAKEDKHRRSMFRSLVGWGFETIWHEWM